MLNVYCWRCGTRINEDDILGIGHFDENVGKYQGKGFIAFRCSNCKKVRYQVLDTNLLPEKRKSVKRHNNSSGSFEVVEHTDRIDINQVIDFYEMLNNIETVDNFLDRCNMSTEVVHPEINKPVIQPLDVYNLFNELNSENAKRLMVLTLDEENFIITWEFMGDGTNQSVSLDPKVIYHTPFLINEKVSVIIADNLQEDFKKASQKEILVTKRLIKAGKILGIKFLDHIVIDNNGFYSFDQLDLI